MFSAFTVAVDFISSRYSFTANHQTEHWDPNGRDKGRTEGAGGDCNAIGRTTIFQNPRAPGSNTPRNTHEGTYSPA